ncbi:MAG: hemerythrin domain-containing protein, partial [Kofleriaceae bacterium]
MTPDQIRSKLLAQHDHIRAHLDTCVRLARELRAGVAVGSELDRVLSLLRSDIHEHNAVETTAIGKLLHGPSAWSSLMIDRMLEEHLAEHAAFWELLCGTRAEVAGRIEELADELEAHMAAEERTFLSSATLREDVIRTRTREG